MNFEVCDKVGYGYFFRVLKGGNVVDFSVDVLDDLFDSFGLKVLDGNNIVGCFFKLFG